jgi:hypothetical protein
VTVEEWNRIAFVMENAWRGGLDDDRAGAYFALLHPFDAVEVERALHVLVRNGNPFVPAVAEIITAIEAQAQSSVPTWPEALAAMRKLIPRYSSKREEGFAKFDEVHPVLASFVATYGWHRLAQEPIDDPDRGGAVLRRIEQSYAEHLEKQQERQRQGLAIEAVERGRISGPRRLDAARLLGVGR